jgi:hypothetical protein
MFGLEGNSENCVISQITLRRIFPTLFEARWINQPPLLGTISALQERFFPRFEKPFLAKGVHQIPWKMTSDFACAAIQAY